MEFGVKRTNVPGSLSYEKSLPTKTHFAAFGKEAPDQSVASASIHLQNAQFRPNFGKKNGVYQALEYEPETYEDTGYVTHPHEALFQTDPAKITGAYADPTMRGAVPALLGMALNEGKKQGYGITYDDSLSAHSSPIAQQGLDAGLLIPNKHNTGANITNSLGMSGNRMVHWERGKYESAPPEQLQAGKDTIRGVLRGRPKQPAPVEDHAALAAHWDAQAADYESKGMKFSASDAKAEAQRHRDAGPTQEKLF